MILLWGIVGDEPLDMVRLALERQGRQYTFLDQQRVENTSLDLEIGATVGGHLVTPEFAVNLREVCAIYLRPYDSRRMRAVERAAPNNPLLRHALNLEDSLLSWVEVTPSLVLNRPSAMASNNSKPYQSKFIQASGFCVPDTLVTTDVEATIAFWEQHRDIIYKSVSGVRSIVSRLKDSHRARLPDIANCPTQFQEYIPGNDWRVHVVGEDAFACEVISDADDYRYAGRSGNAVEIYSRNLPPDVGDCCIRIAKMLRLPLCGIDLRRTPAGAWYCFEANPSPAFSFYEMSTGLPIADAVARFLAQQ
jgi:glutathione synthase/RimK-type ligase-like ATP-grasp enzyme